MKERPRFIRALALLWTVLIFIACAMPGKHVPSVSLPNFDKVVHALFFFLFYFLWALPTKQGSALRMQLLLIAILYGFALEYYQLYAANGRSFDVWDGIADATGAVLGYLSLHLAERKAL